jgi:predicted MFS family arabinose efflux permease
LPYTILMPVFARDVLGLGSRELGFLMASAGVGALLGGLYLAVKRSSHRAGRTIVVSLAVFGASLLGFAASKSYAVSLVLLVAVGASMLVQLATSNAYLQLQAPGRLRGRIVSLYMLAFIGMAPFGALLSGVAARWLGAPMAVGLGGGVCLATGILVSVRVSALRLPRRG